MDVRKDTIVVAVTAAGDVGKATPYGNLALQVQRAAEIRCQLPWARIAHVLSGLKAVRYRCESRTIVQRSKITAELSAMLKTLSVCL